MAHIEDNVFVLILFVLFLLAWRAPLLGNRWLTHIESAGTRLANRKALAVTLVTVGVILLRICLLPIYFIRPPGVQDEFSYLFAADTFVHGRIANPPHPMWIFFDTVHVLQHPTVASKYPPAQGALLAIGQLLGNPWFGVVLSMGAMFGALLWMLQGWFPAKWALLGTVLAILQFGIFSYWMNSYMGGAAAGIGGALVVGALPRLLLHTRTRDALLMGAGIAILANSRQFEGLVFCVPVIISLLYWFFGPRRPAWRLTLWRVGFPLIAVLIATAGFMLYYNWRITGNPYLLPHVLDDQVHVNFPNFFWGDLKPPLHYLNPQFDALFNGWFRSYFDFTWTGFLRNYAEKISAIQKFFLGVGLLIPLATLPWMLRDRRARFLVVQFAVCFAAMLTVIMFNPHYMAPALATLFALLVQMMRHLRRWEFRGRPIGIALTRVVVLLTVTTFSTCLFAVVKNPNAPPCPGWPYFSLPRRAEIAERLLHMPGQHLVIVRYSEEHDPLVEWVYNGADPDHEKIVWAREIPGIDVKPLLDYYSNRTVWLVEPDNFPWRIKPYVAAIHQ